MKEIFVITILSEAKFFAGEYTYNTLSPHTYTPPYVDDRCLNALENRSVDYFKNVGKTGAA